MPRFLTTRKRNSALPSWAVGTVRCGHTNRNSLPIYRWIYASSTSFLCRILETHWAEPNNLSPQPPDEAGVSGWVAMRAFVQLQ
jgi:hypothetical protein